MVAWLACLSHGFRSVPPLSTYVCPLTAALSVPLLTAVFCLRRRGAGARSVRARAGAVPAGRRVAAEGAAARPGTS